MKILRFFHVEPKSKINPSVLTQVLDNIPLFFYTHPSVIPYSLVRLLAGGGLGALPGGQGLLGAEDGGGPPERGLGQVLAVALLHHQALHLVQRRAPARLHLGALERSFKVVS